MLSITQNAPLTQYRASAEGVVYFNQQCLLKQMDSA